MVSSVTATILVVAIVGVGAATLGSFYYIREQAPPVATTAVGTVTPPPEEASPSPTPAPTVSLAPVNQHLKSTTRVEGTQTTSPTPRPSKAPITPSPTPRPPESTAAINATDNYSIEFVDLPSTVDSGQSFAIKWRILGPSGETGSKTGVKVSFDKDTNSNGSRSSVSTNSNTSLGQFQVEQVLSTSFSHGNDPGTLHLTATAEIAGHSLTTTRQVELVD